tara:strand:+ start:8004 stop:9056 length:1053 start_codon:yes stop_codon:yes gene_type:complete
MKISKNKHISLDKFIDKTLYNKKTGYYMNRNPFGKNGDFITAPNISILFSEMISVWCIAFWKNLGKPKKINIVELGSGNGEMMSQMIKVFERFSNFKKSCNYYILEKSHFLKKIQKKKLTGCNVKWIDSLNKLNSGPNIFLANEFFDALPIKQFIKKNNRWFEKKIKTVSKNNFELVDTITNIQDLEKKIGINLSNNQKIIEFSPLTYKYLNIISNKVNSFQGGLLIIDYGYLEKKMKNSLQSVYKHKFNLFFENIAKSDITYNISFYLLKKITKKFNLKVAGLATQKDFLTKLGITQRAEIISKNLLFSKKANIYYRLKRLIDNKFMGELFKVMFITTKNNKFKLGFKN